MRRKLASIDEHIFGCPNCSGRLEKRGQDWFCLPCERRYPTENGIADFRCSRHDYYFNPVPRDAMRKLSSPNTNQSWDDRIRTFLAHTEWNPDWLDNLIADGRYAWKLFLEFPEGARVLDLGCGLGNLTKNIAPSVGTVYAMDLTSERLEFARVRFSEFNPTDRIELLAGGDGPFLPFCENSLDAVFLSGVLEWIPDDDGLWEARSKISKGWRMLTSQFGVTNPRRQQLSFLREVRRVLKPEGQLFIAIENRLNYEYFAGRPDHHSGLKFGALMPRLLANLYSILINKRPYRTYTHSIAGYRKLLAQAGFDDCEFIGLLPGYSKLAVLFPLQERIPYWEFESSLGLKERLSRHPYFVPAFGIVASTEPRPRLLDRLRSRVEQESGFDSGVLALNSYIVTGKDKGIVSGHAGDVRIVIKLPFNRAALEAEERNLCRLRELGENFTLAPQAISNGDLLGVRYFVERAVDGRSLRASMKGPIEAELLASVSHALEQMNPNLLEFAIQLPTDDEIGEIQALLSRLVEALNGKDRVSSVAETLSSRLCRLRARRGLAHGDFSAHNIFVLGSRVTGLIDWENSRRRIPALDAVNFLDSLNRLRDPSATVSDTAVLLATGSWPSRVEADFLDVQCDRSGVARHDIQDLVAYYWVRHVGSQLRYDTRFAGRVLERKVEPFFEYVQRSMHPQL